MLINHQIRVYTWQKEVIAFIVRTFINSYNYRFLDTPSRRIYEYGGGSLAWSRITGCGRPLIADEVSLRQTPVDPSSNLGPRPLTITRRQSNG